MAAQDQEFPGRLMGTEVPQWGPGAKPGSMGGAPIGAGGHDPHV